ncbi:MAG: alpha/beta fold hydrolase [Pseudomonadota bacterium]
MTRQWLRRIVLMTLGLLVAGFIGVTVTRYQRDIGQARQRIATGSQIAQTPCGPIEYAQAGEGPAVLVVHGAGGGYDQGLDFGEALARQGFRIIAMSRFGYLQTPLPKDASAAAQADAHVCLLDALNIRRAAIIGASAGAPSAMQFALRHPDRARALVLLVPAAYVPRAGHAPSMNTPPATEFLFDIALKSDFLFWSAIRFARSTVIESILATPAAVVNQASAAEQTRVERMLAHILPVSPRRLGLLNDAAITSTLARYELERITTPTLAISLADDLFGTLDGARYTAEHVAQARLIAYPSGGHVWVGRQMALVSELAAFLKEGGRAGHKIAANMKAQP